MTLTQFIKDLLFLRDRLYIPGFGSFVAQYIPSQINSEKQILTPPSKYFIFDETTKEDDGVFAKYISFKKSISLFEANQAVKDMVDDFHKKLNDGDTLYIEDVGYLVLAENKTIRFKRDEEKNFDPESYGLNSVAFKSPAQQIETPADVFIPAPRKRSFVKILTIFLIINAVGALAAFVYWKFDDIKTYFWKQAPQQATTVAHDSIEVKVKPDTTALGSSIDTSTNMKNALRYEEEQKIDTSSSIKSETAKRYYIVAGSFQTYAKAEVHSKLLTKLGLKPEIIEFGQELFRVTIGEYKSKEDAMKQLEFLKCKKETEKAWLLSK